MDTATKINEIAGNLTLTGFSLFVLWAIITGKIITVGRFMDSVERATRAETTVEELRLTLQESINTATKLSDSLNSLTERIDDIAEIISEQKTQQRKIVTSRNPSGRNPSAD
jgi:uncharacterized coiled-coil protein SlyX